MADESKKGPVLPTGLGGAFDSRSDDRVGQGGTSVLGERLGPPMPGQPPKPGESKTEDKTQPQAAASPEAPKSFVPRAAFSAVAPPTLDLPQGGGAIRGIGETLRSNPATGTAGFDIPLPLTPAPHGPTPSMALSYDSGQGNGVFGAGWRSPSRRSHGRPTRSSRSTATARTPTRSFSRAPRISSRCSRGWRARKRAKASGCATVTRRRRRAG
jgi:hypothetical protein